MRQRLIEFRFLSTLSLRRATLANKAPFEKFEDFYPRSPCGERRLSIAFKVIICLFLSTLSLRRATTDNNIGRGDIIFLSTLSLRRATVMNNIIFMPREFLSTLSLRRATSSGIKKNLQGFNFYPRSPCGERPRQAGQQQQHHNISIHALLAESDADGLLFFVRRRNFYPRSPCGERLHH